MMELGNRERTFTVTRETVEAIAAWLNSFLEGKVHTFYIEDVTGERVGETYIGVRLSNPVSVHDHSDGLHQQVLIHAGYRWGFETPVRDEEGSEIQKEPIISFDGKNHVIIRLPFRKRLLFHHFVVQPLQAAE